MAVVVQRRPGTKQGLVSRLFDGESDVHTKPAKPEQVSPDVHKKRASKQVVAKKPAKARRK